MGLNDAMYPFVAATLPTGFGYAGGSFPGNGGTCSTGSNLQGITNAGPNGGSCTIALVFAPISPVAYGPTSNVYFLPAGDPAYNQASFGLSGMGQ
jgi:hypothetical protein